MRTTPEVLASAERRPLNTHDSRSSMRIVACGARVTERKAPVPDLGRYLISQVWGAAPSGFVICRSARHTVPFRPGVYPTAGRKIGDVGGGTAGISTGSPVRLSITETYACTSEPVGTSTLTARGSGLTAAAAPPNRLASESCRYSRVFMLVVWVAIVVPVASKRVNFRFCTPASLRRLTRLKLVLKPVGMPLLRMPAFHSRGGVVFGTTAIPGVSSPYRPPPDGGEVY